MNSYVDDFRSLPSDEPTAARVPQEGTSSQNSTTTAAGFDRRSAGKRIKKPQQRAVVASLRIAGLPWTVTAEDLRFCLVANFKILVSEVAFSNADTVVNGYNVAYLGFLTVGAAMCAETALRRYIDGEEHSDELSVLLKDCELQLLCAPSSIDRHQDASEDTPTPTGPLPKVLPSTQHEGRLDELKASATSANVCAASAGGQWQPAKRDPRHALSFSNEGDRSPSVCFDGMSPGMNHVASGTDNAGSPSPLPTTEALIIVAEQPGESDPDRDSRLSKRRRFSNS